MSGGGGGGGPAIAGIVGGVVAAVVAVVAIVALVKWKQQRGRVLKPTDIRDMTERRSSRVLAYSNGDDADMSEVDDMDVAPTVGTHSVSAPAPAPAPAPVPVSTANPIPALLSPNSRRDRVQMVAVSASPRAAPRAVEPTR
jgi:hypothetical protein